MGDVSVDSQPHATWVQRQLPKGEKCWEVDMSTMATLTTSRQAVTIAAETCDNGKGVEGCPPTAPPADSVSKAKGKGKGVKGSPPPAPPADSVSKGKGKGSGKGNAGNRLSRMQRMAAEAEAWTPVLSPGVQVMTKLSDMAYEELDLHNGRFIETYIEKEGVLLGWDASAGMWAVRMLSGTIWFVRADHLAVRNPVHSSWVPAVDAPHEARQPAPDFSRAQSYEFSKTLDMLRQECSEA